MTNTTIKLGLIMALIGAFLLGPVSALAQQAALTAVINTPAAGQILTVGESFTFTGAAAGGNSVFYAYLWNFGDGTFGAGATFDKTYDITGPKTISLTVTDFDGQQASLSRNIVVNSAPPPPPPPPPPPTPTVDLLINGGSGPVALTAGASAALSWTSTNATVCTASGGWSGSKATSGTESTGALAAGAYTYTLTCTGAGGSATDSVTANVAMTADTTPPTAPTITSADPSANATSTNATSTITWSVSTDTGSGLAGYSFIWDNSPTTNPDNVVDTTANTRVQTLSNGTWYFHIIAVDNASNVSAPTTHYGPVIITGVVSPVAPVISNIRITDITQTGATIRWTTDILADSRVIYDTVSHSTLGTPPNFGYAFSSALQNTSPKVTEHAIALVGLTPNTQYFFRVLSQS